MVTGIFGLMFILVTLACIRGKTDQWRNDKLFPTGVFGVNIYLLLCNISCKCKFLKLQILSTSALSLFSFPTEFPSIGNRKYTIGLTIFLIVSATIAFIAGCLSTITQFR